MSINIYYIDHFYLEDDDIELKPFFLVLMMFMDILKKIMVRNILILIIHVIIKKILQKHMLLWDDIKDIIENKAGKPFFVKDF